MYESSIEHINSGNVKSNCCLPCVLHFNFVTNVVILLVKLWFLAVLLILFCKLLSVIIVYVPASDVQTCCV